MKLNPFRLYRLLLPSLLLCLVLPPLSVNAQKPGAAAAPAETSDVVRISTDLIQTDVMVFDREGRFVDGLEREQFELRVDGQSVPISFFERAGGKATAKSAAPRTSRAVQHGRQIIFFLDDLHLAAERIEQVRNGLLHFVENEMRPGDQVAIVTASGQLGFLQQFTDHKSVARAAIARLKHRPRVAQDTGESVTMTEYIAYRIAQGDRDALDYYVNEQLRSTQFQYSLPKYGGKGAGFMVGSEGDQMARVVMQRAQWLLAQSADASAATFTALESFLRSSAQTGGRKVVFFISDGLLLHGGDATRLQRITDASARAGSLVYAVDARSFAGGAQATRARTDATGRFDKFSSGELEATRLALKELASSTGGRALLDAKALDTTVQETLKESFNYYLLAWRPESEKQKLERFRQTEVKIVGRPDLSVRMTRGYLEGDVKAPTEASAAKRTATQNAALSSSTQTLPTRLSVGFINTPNNGSVLAASTQVTVAALSDSDNDKQPAAIDLAGVILNEQGAQAASFKTRLNVEKLSAAQPQALSPNVIYNYRAPLKPGIYQVRVAARDAGSGRTGNAKQWIEIPDLTPERLTLSSLFLGGQEVAETSDKKTVSDAAAPQMQFSVDRRFARASRLSFFLFIYNARQAATQLTADIRVTQEGQTLLTLPQQKVSIEATTDARRIPFGGAFPLRSLPAGRYTLEVTITDRNAQASAAQQIEFEVE